MIGRVLRVLFQVGAHGWGWCYKQFLRIAFPLVTLGDKTILVPGCRLFAADGGRLHLGAGTAVNGFAQLLAKSGRIVIGDHCFIGTGSIIVAVDEISIGHNVLIAEYVTIRDQDHDFESRLPTALAGLRSSPIRVGDNVWIGAKATITRGVTIGDNSVIGANAVVTRDVPSNAVVGGVPARVIRFRQTLDGAAAE
jgi:acetyltransferase-like isoleucine patch superfamily enzyme